MTVVLVRKYEMIVKSEQINCRDIETNIDIEFKHEADIGGTLGFQKSWIINKSAVRRGVIAISLKNTQREGSASETETHHIRNEMSEIKKATPGQSLNHVILTSFPSYSYYSIRVEL